MCYGTKLAALSQNLGGIVPQSPPGSKQLGGGRVSPPFPQWLRPWNHLKNKLYFNI
jgi:hypothetical protein